MKRKNTARNALITSILSLLLCVSMLVGATFAWFTDEVTTGMNTISAGNLDIEVTTDSGEDIQDMAALFDGILWEPGVVAYENLNIENVGTLALKYAMYINFANENYVIEADGTETSFGLSSALKAAVVDSAELDTTSRETLVASVTEWTSLETLSAGAELLPEKMDEASIVIWWEPTDVDNNWNVHNGKTTTDGEPLHIDLGVKILATQLMHEKDSFGDDYDEDAKLAIDPAAIVNTITANGVDTVFYDIVNGSIDLNDVQKVTLDTAYSFKGESPETAAQNQYADWFVDFYVSVDKAPKEGLFLSGQYDQFFSNWVAFEVPTGTDDNGNPLIEAGKFYPLLGSVTGGGVSNWTYLEICDGVGTFNCGAMDKNFNNEGTTLTVQLRLINPEDTNETITVREVKYTFANSINTADELKDLMAAGKNATLAADIALDNNDTITIASGNDVTIDLNGHKLSASADKTGNQEAFLVKGDLTVKNGSMEMTALNNQGWGAMAAIFDVTAGGALKLDGVKASVAGTDMNFIVHLNNWGSAAAEITNCDFDLSYVAVRAFNSGYDMNTVTIKNTDVTGGGRLFWVHNYTSEGKDDSTLTLDIYSNGNTCENAKPVRFGFSNEVYFDLDGNAIV